MYINLQCCENSIEMWLCFTLFFLLLDDLDCSLISDWSIPIEYSVAGSEFRPLGRVVVRDVGDGEFIGAPLNIHRQLADAFASAIAANQTDLSYKIRAGDVYSSTYPCLFAFSNMSHEISVSVDAERQQIHSVNVFPAGVYDLSAANEKVRCQPDLLESQRGGSMKFSAVIKVLSIGELPSPDTVTYLQRIEDEKRARQHGAQQDNRSFIAKYWMYILPVVVFMVVSNVFTPDAPAQGE